jgi:Ras-related protein Rab-5C
MGELRTKGNRHKIVLIGPSSAGKTSIVHRYAKGNFFEGVQQPTIGSAFYARDVETPTGRVSLNIWDTAGMDRYKSLVPRYSKGASAAIIVFDIMENESYNDAKTLLVDVPNSCDTQLVLFFVANKIDRGCAIDVQEAREFAESNHATFMETSAQTGQNVQELFEQIANRLGGTAAPTGGVDIAAATSQGSPDGAAPGAGACC